MRSYVKGSIRKMVAGDRNARLRDMIHRGESDEGEDEAPRGQERDKEREEGSKDDEDFSDVSV